MTIVQLQTNSRPWGEARLSADERLVLLQVSADAGMHFGVKLSLKSARALAQGLLAQVEAIEPVKKKAVDVATSRPLRVEGQVHAERPPLQLPTTGYVRQSQLLKFVPFSKTTLWRKVKAGDFPAPVKLSQGVTAWRAEDVHAWIAAQASAQAN